jgi:hypothetical protein
MSLSLKGGSGPLAARPHSGLQAEARRIGRRGVQAITPKSRELPSVLNEVFLMPQIVLVEITTWLPLSRVSSCQSKRVPVPGEPKATTPA